MKNVKNLVMLVVLATCGYSCFCPKKVSFEGCYSTSWTGTPHGKLNQYAPMYLEVTNGVVKGAWGSNGNFGELSGKLNDEGQLLVGEWATPYLKIDTAARSVYGNYWFFLSNDGRKFTGWWNRLKPQEKPEDEGRYYRPKSWNGERVGCATVAQLDTLKSRIQTIQLTK